MKKIIILTLMLFTAFSSTAFADSIDNIDISRNENGEVIISGSLNVSKTNQQLILTVTNQGTLITAEQTTVTEVKNEKAYFEFAPVLFPYDASSGIYTYTVSGRYIDEAKSKTDDKMSVSTNDFYTHISCLNQKIQAGSEEEVYAYLSANSTYLDIDGARLSSLNRTLPVFKKLLLDKQFVCDEDDYKSIENARDDFRKRYSDLISICMFYQIDSLTSYNNWIENYSRDFPNETKDAEMYPYYTRIKNKQTVADKITKLNSVYITKNLFGTFAEEKANIRSIFYEGVFLTNIYEENAAVAQNIITGFKDYFPTDNTYYNKLLPQKKGEVFGLIKGKSYDDSEAVCSDFLTYSKQLSNSSNNSGNHGGGSGGSGGGGGSVGGSWGKDSSLHFTEPIPAHAEAAFDDIENVSWAKEAILELYERNIVSGKAEKVFAPDDYITRAEFIAMVVRARGIEIVPATEKLFDDVELDKWYADVVNTAKVNGIISGDENNNFSPEKQITRQDMSIIVARALGYISDGSRYAPFGDLDAIDNYALEYVVYLYGQGLLSGNEEGLFLPKNNTRRSEAAVLIYRMIMSNEL